MCLSLVRKKQVVTLSLKIRAESNAIKRSYQVGYDVMVAFYMFAHTDSLKREQKEKRKGKTLLVYHLLKVKSKVPSLLHAVAVVIFLC